MGLSNLKRIFIFGISFLTIFSSSFLYAQGTTCSSQPTFVDVAGISDPNFPDGTKISSVAYSSFLNAIVTGGFYQGNANFLGSTYFIPASTGVKSDGFVTLVDPTSMIGVTSYVYPDALTSTTVLQDATDIAFYENPNAPAFALCLVYGDPNSQNTEYVDTNFLGAPIGANHIVPVIGIDSVTVGTTNFASNAIYTNTSKSQDANSYVKAVEVTYDSAGFVYGTGNAKGNIQLVCNASCNSPVLSTNNNSQDIYVVAFNQGMNRFEHFSAILFGGPGNDEVTSITANPVDGSILIAGNLDFSQGPIIDPVNNSSISFPGGKKGFSAKIDGSTGVFLAFGILDSGTSESKINDIAVDNNGDIFIAGYIDGSTDFDFGRSVSANTQVGLRDAFLAKYGVAGNFKWKQTLGLAGYPAVINKIVVNSQGDILAAATAYNFNYTDAESVALKFKGDDTHFGALSFIPTFIGSSAYFDEVSDLALYGNGGMIIALSGNGTSGFPGVVVRYSDPCNP